MNDPTDESYAFLDCGGGRRLERLGGVIVSRPAPAAIRSPLLPEGEWRRAALAFSRGGGWRGDPPQDWRAAFGPAVLALRPAAQGQVGAFPEHATVADRLDDLLAGIPGSGRRALNLFAHTGLASLRLAAGGAAVAHVDAAQAAVRQARENAALSGLSAAPIRWLVDDVLGFVRREVRRGSRYDLIVADPPSYGRGGKGGEWKLDRDLPILLEACAALLAEGPAVLCLTCHSEGWNGARLADAVKRILPEMNVSERMELRLASSCGGGALACGSAVFALRG